VGAGAEELAGSVRHAGCVFIGAASGTAFGDYIAGSNHVLPTNGAARFASALSPMHFRRRFTEIRIGDGAAQLARTAAPLARAEGFELHARSMEARIRDNGSG
jgi:histidinol dehydrogenase